ncbi:NAD(P)/FAD-dependent oxidoreductase [Rubinisphaera italica]|uniref:Protoporphyrinogen oxidase n=1 Tax=Rubinisphaera italica TaxID=2527969 RepID=A0A5C5XJQ2_9PLAN|nr:FAD-dependent oxidoreductase [Rubinisphaera italica]TWT63064.1 protoporphyrinogen oxidase [Rubinisphaera italica]
MGSGISGLTCAKILQPHHQITVFEAADYVGGHTHTIDVETSRGTVGIDTGFIVYNERTYPNFIRLIESLNVETQETRMGFSVRCHETDFEYNGESLGGLIADKRNLIRPRFYRMLWDLTRFYRDAAEYLQSTVKSDHTSSELTVAEFARQHRYSQSFIKYHLLPMGAAIWSCNVKSFGEFPFRFVAEFYQNHGLIQVSNRPMWRVIRGGSYRYVEKLTEAFMDRIRLKTPVQSVVRNPGHLLVTTSEGVEKYDHVILACHSDTALKIVQEPDEIEREILSDLPYTANTAVLHTDISILPRRRKNWASWNYALYPDYDDVPTLTYNMNILQSLNLEETYCVTLNSSDKIDPDLILGTYQYDHPVFTTKRERAQKRHGEMIGRNGLSYCGAYWRNGFHEDGVISGMAVCQQWGLNPGWILP